MNVEPDQIADSETRAPEHRERLVVCDGLSELAHHSMSSSI